MKTNTIESISDKGTALVTKTDLIVGLFLQNNPDLPAKFIVDELSDMGCKVSNRLVEKVRKQYKLDPSKLNPYKENKVLPSNVNIDYCRDWHVIVFLSVKAPQEGDMEIVGMAIGDVLERSFSKYIKINHINVHDPYNLENSVNLDYNI